MEHRATGGADRRAETVTMPRGPGLSNADHPAMLEWAEERQRLFERLSEIQRSISHGAPLQEVLDAITEGASRLLGDEVVGLRLVDAADPEYCELASSHGVRPSLLDRLRRSRVGEGAGGRAIAENRLVILEEYGANPDALPQFAGEGLQSAMAAPVLESGKVVGSLVVASYRRGRTYSPDEQEVLIAFAQHAGLALADARTVEAMREAQHAREMYLATVSHGLKTPLAALAGTLATIEKHRESITAERFGRMMGAARERVNELEQLVTRLLEGFRAELTQVRREVDLHELIRDAVTDLGQGRPLEVREVPRLRVLVDPWSVRQILGILMENALAHSDDGDPISVDTDVTDTEITTTISNPGSLPEELDPQMVFEPFRRGRESSPGVGLGLYIASQIAAAVGGRLGIAAQDGAVSFTFAFPLERPPPIPS